MKKYAAIITLLLILIIHAAAANSGPATRGVPCKEMMTIEKRHVIVESEELVFFFKQYTPTTI